MSWPMPPGGMAQGAMSSGTVVPGQWNAGMPIVPDMSMGSCTPEQWAMMQQQSWQWAQWQQQYAQWQTQYGDKYVQQMQMMQNMGMPPLPTSSVPPPAPPPPDKPPPPPHENDEPLYTKKPTPVPPPTNQPEQSQQKPKPVEAETHLSVNSDALNKLAEEERLFDIQFQKWEEEIEKWKQENVNHPDKRAYSEYEQKFEACRGQLLERRQQMKLKRARLLGNTPQTSNNTNISKISTNVPPPSFNKPDTQNYGSNVPPVQKNYKDNSRYNNQSVSQYTKPPQSYNRNNINISLHERPEYNNEYNEENTDNSFLPTSSKDKGIPGLDLVPEERPHTQDVIDITDGDNEYKQKQQSNVAPDYTRISQGINNILGDEKIMNILSMVAGGQKPPPIAGIPPMQLNDPPPQNNQWNNNSNYNDNSYKDNNYNDNYNENENYYNENYNDNSYGNNNYNNDNYGNRQPMNNFNRLQDQFSNQKFPNDRQRQPNDMPQGQYVDNRQGNVQQEEYYDNDKNSKPYGNQNMPMRNMPPPMHQNQGPRPLMSVNAMQNNPDHIPGRGMQEVAPIVEPPKRKWVEEPLFAPSIVVEYDHKPLRGKAQDFIEPVHMFEYNHKSKDGEGANKRNFDKEGEELFTRKPRRSENDLPYDKYGRDSHYRDRPSRDGRDGFPSDSTKENDFYQRRYDDRRHEDRDRGRKDDPYRDDYDKSRDFSRERYPRDYDRDSGREREFGRERDIGKERESDRDFSRGKEFSRDFTRDRDRDNGRDRDLGDKDLGRDRDRDTVRDKGRDYGRDRDSGRDRDYDRGRDRDRDYGRDRYRDRRDKSHSRERDRKRALSKESEMSNSSESKKLKEAKANTASPKQQHIVMIDDILEPPGREMRPMKIVIILRGPPGSGKSYLAKLIRDRESEHGGTARIMSIDDYFMQEGEVEEKDPATGKTIKKPTLKYEYDEKSEETYINSLKRAFKRCVTDGYFTFLIFDAVNDQLKSYADIWNFSRQNGFQVYICTMDLDPQVCHKRNIHNRKLEDIEVITSRFFPTPAHHIQLDATTLLQSASITDVQMEDASDDVMEIQETEVEHSFTSKWEKMDDATQLARLDGISKPLRPSQLSMEDYLQLDDWKPNTAKPGKKTVRWADLEERREQEKMRAIGFVVGQTDWNRMTDPTMGSSALTQTKYIERVRRH